MYGEGKRGGDDGGTGPPPLELSTQQQQQQQQQQREHKTDRKTDVKIQPGVIGDIEFDTAFDNMVYGILDRRPNSNSNDDKKNSSMDRDTSISSHGLLLLWFKRNRVPYLNAPIVRIAERIHRENPSDAITIKFLQEWQKYQQYMYSSNADYIRNTVGIGTDTYDNMIDTVTFETAFTNPYWVRSLSSNPSGAVLFPLLVPDTFRSLGVHPIQSETNAIISKAHPELIPALSSSSSSSSPPPSLPLTIPSGFSPYKQAWIHYCYMQAARWLIDDFVTRTRPTIVKAIACVGGATIGDETKGPNTWQIYNSHMLKIHRRENETQHDWMNRMDLDEIEELIIEHQASLRFPNGSRLPTWKAQKSKLMEIALLAPWRDFITKEQRERKQLGFKQRILDMIERTNAEATKWVNNSNKPSFDACQLAIHSTIGIWRSMKLEDDAFVHMVTAADLSEQLTKEREPGIKALALTSAIDGIGRGGALLRDLRDKSRRRRMYAWKHLSPDAVANNLNAHKRVISQIAEMEVKHELAKFNEYVRRLLDAAQSTQTREVGLEVAVSIQKMIEMAASKQSDLHPRSSGDMRSHIIAEYGAVMYAPERQRELQHDIDAIGRVIEWLNQSLTYIDDLKELKALRVNQLFSKYQNRMNGIWKQWLVTRQLRAPFIRIAERYGPAIAKVREAVNPASDAQMWMDPLITIRGVTYHAGNKHDILHVQLKPDDDDDVLFDEWMEAITPLCIGMHGIKIIKGQLPIPI